MVVSIVIVNWNACDELLECLASVERNPPTTAFEVIVVDNASLDASVETVRAAHPWVKLIANPSNRGLAAANNQGIVASSGRYILIANPDVQFQAGSVDALVDAMDRYPRAAFVFAQLVDPDGTRQTSAGALPTLRYALLGRSRQPAPAGDPPYSTMWWDHWDHSTESIVGHGLEACYLARREAIADIGPQDERYFLDWEGLDWCDRARRRSWEIWFTPKARVIHLGSRSISKARFRSVVRTHRGMYLYFADRMHPVVRPLLAIALVVRTMLKFVAMTLRRGYFSRFG